MDQEKDGKVILEALSLDPELTLSDEDRLVTQNKSVLIRAKLMDI